MKCKLMTNCNLQLTDLLNSKALLLCAMKHTTTHRHTKTLRWWGPGRFRGPLLVQQKGGPALSGSFFDFSGFLQHHGQTIQMCAPRILICPTACSPCPSERITNISNKMNLWAKRISDFPPKNLFLPQASLLGKMEPTPPY